MTADDLVRGVVRIWSTSEASEIVGTGVLVAPGLVITCAHVAARAWGEAPDLEGGVGRMLRIDFPATAPHAWITADVVMWRPRRPAAGGMYDLAGLRFSPPARFTGVALPLVDDPLPWGKAVRAFGFPGGRPDGAYASGTLRDVLANGWVLVKGGAEAREFTRPGYSGGPVATDDGVVGLLSEGDSDVRVREAMMIPVRAILAAWPELQHAVTRAPFPGLAPFTADDAEHFRGRDRAIHELTAALLAPPHLVVLAGPSGSGKSSLIAAGILPALAAGDTPEGRSWRTLVWTPGAAAFATLARSLLRAADDTVDATRLAVEAARLAHDLERGVVTLPDLLGQDDDARWVIAIDQPEDFLMETSDEQGRISRSRRVFDALLALQSDDRLRNRVALLLAVRTDFLDDLLRHPALARRAGGDVVRYLGPIDDLREVIEGPLRVGGVTRLEAGLTDRLLSEVAYLPNPLPLLQFTLAELWRKRRGGRLTHEAFDEMGGVRRAIANRAERLVSQFDAVDLATVRDVLMQLGRPGSGDTVARRTARFEDLGDRARRIITKLADARLVVTDRDATGVEQVDVMHEALFEHWPRLQAWWREAAEFRRWQESFRFAVRIWIDEGQNPNDLLRGPRLRTAEMHLRERPDSFSPQELAYVLRSVAHEQEADAASRLTMQRELRVRRRMNLLLGALLFVAVGLMLATARQAIDILRSRAEIEALLRASTAANVALERAKSELERAGDGSRAILARQLGTQAVAIANDPATFDSGMRLAALLAAYAVRIDPGPSSYDHLLRVVTAQPTYRATLANDATSVALSPDARFLAVGDGYGGIRLVDPTDGRSIGERVRGHAGAVTALAFSPDGRRIVSGGGDGQLLAWSTEPLRREGAFPGGHEGPIAAIAVTYDGGVWLSSDLTGTLRSWDATHRTELASFGRYEAANATVVDGVAGVAAPAAAAIPVLTTALDGFDHAAAHGHRAWSAAIATHPQRDLIAVAVADGVTVLDARTLTPVWQPVDASSDTAGVTFDADGATLIAVNERGVIQRWPLHHEDAPKSWPSSVAGIRTLARGTATDLILVGSANGASIWVDLTTGRPQEPPLRGHAIDVTSLAVGDQLIITASSDGRVLSWDRTARRSLGLRLPTVGPLPHALAIDAASEIAYVGSVDGTLARISLVDAAAQATVTFAHPGGVTGAVITPEHFATVGYDGILVLRDPVTLAAQTTRYTQGDPLWSVTLDAETAAWIVGGLRGGVTRVPWLAGEGAAVVRHPSRTWSPGAVVADAHDGTWAVALEHRIELWRGDTLVGRVDQLQDAAVNTLAFDPSGTRLLASSGSLVTLWEVPNLTLTEAWVGARFAAFSADGRFLARVENDGGILLLDGGTLAPIGLPFRGHTTPPPRLAFTPDGRWLITIDDAGGVWRWPTHTEAWLDHACEIAWPDLHPDEIAALLGDQVVESPCGGADG